MQRRLALIVLLLGTGAAFASERLSPEISIAADSAAGKIATARTEAFADLYKDNARIRATFEFAKDPDFAVGIVEDGGVFRILVLDSSVRLATLPAKPRAGIQSCTTAINTPLATRVIALWRNMLLRVRPEDKPEIDGGGISVGHFSMPHENTMLSGYDTMPAPESNTALLEEIAYNMFNYCVEQKTAELQNLERNILKLEQKLR